MGSRLTREDVLRIATLARLELAPGEIDDLTRQLGTIVDYAAEVQQVDTAGVPGAALAGDQTSWREDRVIPPIDRTAALSQAPEASVEAGLFRVPKVL